MWLRETTSRQRRTLLAGFLGYGVDGFDFMVYTFVIPTLIAEWGMSRTEAGYIATGALFTSAIGGWAAGILADRFAHPRVHAHAHYGFRHAVSWISPGLVIVAAWALPETRGRLLRAAAPLRVGGVKAISRD